MDKISFSHGGAPGGRPVNAAPNVKKNCAPRTRHRRIGIVPDFNEPMISEIARAHFFMRVVVRRIFWIDHDMTIVVGRSGIITPDVGLGDLMVRIICAGRQSCVIAENLADLKNTSWGAAVPLHFAQPGFILSGPTRSPGQTAFAKQYRNRRSDRGPGATARPFEELERSARRVPIGRETEDELGAIFGHTLSTCIADEEEEHRADGQPAQDRHKHFQT